MSKVRHSITLLLTLAVLVLIVHNFTNSDKNSRTITNDNSEPTYTSANSQTMIYNPQGALTYNLVSDKVTFFQNEAVSWFENPFMTIYDENKIPIWSVQTDNAKLTNHRMLYLYGHVEVKSLTKYANLERIKTDNARINLTTQDVTANNQVVLYGHNFNSIGMKMYGNLREKTTNLIENVRTSYEIQNEKHL